MAVGERRRLRPRASQPPGALQDPRLELALFGWAAGQDTTFHDHGGASGAAFVCTGVLIEDSIAAAEGYVVDRDTHLRWADSAFSFGPDYIHRVRHDPAHGVALSIHAYTPAGSEANDYEIEPDGRLRVIGAVRQPRLARSALV